MDIFRELILIRDQENVLISPVSILSTLSILYHATKGSASDKILNYIEENTDTDTEDNDNMEIDTKECTELVTVNKVYGSSSIRFYSEFLEKIKNDFETINFNNTELATYQINEWVRLFTNNKISKLFNSLSNDTRMLLVGAAHFKAKWKYPFPKEYTYKDNFYISYDSTTVDTMVIKDKSFLYNHVDEPFGSFSIVDIPYEGNSSMMIILPDELDGLKDAEEDILINENFKKWISDLSLTRVDIYLPKFNVEVTEPYDLVHIFKKVGLSDIFKDSNLHISNEHITIDGILHKSFIEVNEEYTEAASASCFQFTKNSLIKPIIFHADHPFIYIIKDTCNRILFIGKYYFPNK
ncbi:serine protease inhibitor-like protein [Murmansk poxvirus]|uniref:Serine protease inhibitor-like protein n=1 Tax=Murmansk poxvirus TaxID=2025359 RepID=A0A223FN45_9POXV|nr:serine protease inhibitor-like protein [Murmansk poxvirus]AST09397.1 serine protease inhibitor-like protein [Murmansk poxvirus]